MRLVRSHVDLAKAEFSEIADEIKRVAALGGIAIGLVLLAGLILPIGGILFLGEWLLGSIGWGVLLGSLFLIDLAVVLVLVAIGIGRGVVGTGLGGGLVIGIVAGVLVWANLGHRLWTAVGDGLGLAVAPETRPVVTALLVLGLGLGLIFAVVGVAASGGGRRLGGLIGGAIGGLAVGSILGLVTAVEFGLQSAIGLGALVGFIAWPSITAYGAFRDGIDTEALKARFYPTQTIETTKETIEWVREQTPLGPRS